MLVTWDCNCWTAWNYSYRVWWYSMKLKSAGGQGLIWRQSFASSVVPVRSCDSCVIVCSLSLEIDWKLDLVLLTLTQSECLSLYVFTLCDTLQGTSWNHVRYSEDRRQTTTWSSEATAMLPFPGLKRYSHSKASVFFCKGDQDQVQVAQESSPILTTTASMNRCLYFLSVFDIIYSRLLSSCVVASGIWLLSMSSWSPVVVAVRVVVVGAEHWLASGLSTSVSDPAIRPVIPAKSCKVYSLCVSERGLTNESGKWHAATRRETDWQSESKSRRFVLTSFDATWLSVLELASWQVDGLHSMTVIEGHDVIVWARMVSKCILGS